ncbi:Zinc finger protein [Plakobranchus ocellatus]|uniref:Zinc finger protein n=1 Tax=Plakobranchus ocellatus TaxID=259542 RepID=A0AAV4BLE8_9GAST|nr:Zinc finger protein [Plakobranchus ocellatus]
MDFGSFYKQRELRRAGFVKSSQNFQGQGEEFNQEDGSSRYETGGSFYGQLGRAGEQSAFREGYRQENAYPTYPEESLGPYSRHGMRPGLYEENADGQNANFNRSNRNPYFDNSAGEIPFRGDPPKRSLRGKGRGRGRGRGISAKGTRANLPYPMGRGEEEGGHDQTHPIEYNQGEHLNDVADSETYQSYQGYNNSYEQNPESDEYTSTGLDNFTEDTMYTEGMYGFDVMDDPCGNNSEGRVFFNFVGQKETSESADCLQSVNKEPTVEVEEKKKQGLTQESNDSQAPVPENEDGKNSDQESEDDETSEAIKKLPPSHSRGLMSTLIGMLGPEVLNRKPDPIPPPQPAKLKDQHEVYLQQKREEATIKDKDETGEEKEDEYFDVMDLPPEQRNLKPDDFEDALPSSLFCKICHVQTTSTKNLQDHLDGKNHRAKLVGLMCGKVSIPGSKTAKKKFLLARSELGKKSLILESLKNVKDEPLLGLAFITEFQSLDQVMCVCNLCGVKFDSNAALSHISGSKHRYQYMKEKRPAEYVHLKRFGGKRTHLVNFLQELSFDVEKDDGRGTPVIKVFEKNEPDEPGGSKEKSVAKEEKDVTDEDSKEDTTDKEKGIELDQIEKDKDLDKMEKKDKEPDKVKIDKVADDDGKTEEQEVKAANAELCEEEYFHHWVESECKKSKEARELRKSLSPSSDRFDTSGRSNKYDHDDRPRQAYKFRQDSYPRGRPRYPQPMHPFEGPRPPMYPFGSMRHPYPPRHSFDHFEPPGLRPFPLPHVDPYFDDLYRDQREFPPSLPPAQFPRDLARPVPYVDPDPIRRLDALRKARQESDPLNRVPPRSEPYLDPDPLKRVLKREAVQKPVVIDYSHGNIKSEKPQANRNHSENSWEDDIESILGQDKDKNLNSLAMLSDTYSSPQRSPISLSARPKEETKIKRVLPFSKSYLDIPENREKLKNLRKRAKSPPVVGVEQEVIDLTKSDKRSRSMSSDSSSSSSSSPSVRSGKERGPKSSHPTYSLPKSLQQTIHKDYGPKRFKRANSPQRQRSPNFDKRRDQNDIGHRMAFLSAYSSNPRDTADKSSNLTKRDEQNLEPKRPPTNFLKPEEDYQQPTDLVRREGQREHSKMSLPASGSIKEYFEKTDKMEVERVPSKEKRTSELHHEVEGTTFLEDNEDEQAEKIADMLLKMSSSLSSVGDTQATLQALLSNPELAQTILEAQSELEKKPPRKERSISSADASNLQSNPPGSHYPHSSSQHSKSQGPGQANDQAIKKQPQATKRERVAFSLGGRNSLPQSSVFEASSDEDEHVKK